MTMHNVDDILHQRPKNQTTPIQVESQSAPEPLVSAPDVANDPVESAPAQENDEQLTYIDQFRQDKEEFLGKKEGENAENLQNTQENSENSENKTSNPSEYDEYGNQVSKPRTYSEEEFQQELNKRIRDRLSRGRYAQETQQQFEQNFQQATKDFKADPNSSESWETQLESFVVNTMNKVQQQQQQQQWQQQEQAIQADFETRFTNGIEKFHDFRDVVANKPITNSMMMAARSMKDPASFIYAAAKQQPKELERIASIPDPYQQAAEMGRLEERMRKARTVSSAPKPSVKVKSDVGSKYNENPSIDSRIMSDARRKFRGGVR